MKILHTSDWHLGAAEGNRSLAEDQRFFIDAICFSVRTQGVEAVLLAGDVFDRSMASAEAIGLYDYAMTRLCRELKVPVLVIAGNHDGAERLASCAELLSEAGLYVCGSLRRQPCRVSLGDTDFYLLPWITEEKVKSLFPEKKEEIASAEDAYRVVTDALRADFVPGRRHILLAHAFLTDSETSLSDRAAEIGFAAQVSAHVFDGFDYVALGHIHKPQDVTDTIRYSGTPMPYSFGKEETQQKSVTILDTRDLSRRMVPLPLLHRRTTLTGTLEELLVWEGPEETAAGFVRLRVTDRSVGPEALSALRQRFPLLTEVSGKSLEGQNGALTLTVEDLERMETDPVELFRYFCREEMDTEPSEHLVDLFTAAVQKAEEERK